MYYIVNACDYILSDVAVIHSSRFSHRTCTNNYFLHILTDVQAVLAVLRDADFFPSQWRALGRRLGVDGVDLDTINADHSREGVQRCLEAVIDNWRRNRENTWEVLAEAVSHCEDAGGGRNTARKIREEVGLTGIKVLLVSLHIHVL